MGETKELVQVGRISALSTVFMVTIGISEIAVGFFTGSLGLVGDGIGSFANAATSILVWIGLRISRRGPDARFHFGYLRAETFYSMLAAIVIAGGGLVVIYQSYSTLYVARELRSGSAAIAVAFVAMTLSTLVSGYKIVKARSMELLSMKTEAVNSATDSLSSIIAFVGITVADRLGIIQFDSIVGILIGMLVLISSYLIIRESSLVLMDACTSTDVRRDLQLVAGNVPGVVEVRRIRLRRLGSYLIGDLILGVDGGISVEEAYGISKNVEEEARKLFDEIYEIVIKLEPIGRAEQRIVPESG
ncbi:cation diffusion facilitator family transporter [Candidatus Bathyarchaeota archaeon]|nr:cation diffusion facilitator family transporter [Candidatus Bathyarchaeota archaeon]